MTKIITQRKESRRQRTDKEEEIGKHERINVMEMKDKQEVKKERDRKAVKKNTEKGMMINGRRRNGDIGEGN